MPWVGFEHTIPASERAKTVHTLDRSATVTGSVKELLLRNPKKWKPDSLIHDGRDNSGRIYKGILWLKKGCFSDDDDNDGGGDSLPSSNQTSRTLHFILIVKRKTTTQWIRYI
jgi:hypothetical protein